MSQSATAQAPHWQPGVASTAFASGDQAAVDFASADGDAPGVYDTGVYDTGGYDTGGYDTGDYGTGGYNTGDPAGSAFYAEGESFVGEGCVTGGRGLSCGGYPVGRPQWSAGVEFTILRPYFENNAAFTLLESDGAECGKLFRHAV